MTEDTQRQWGTEAELRLERIRAQMPNLLTLRSDLQKAGLEPSAVMLFEGWNPDEVDDNFTHPPQMMGLPVVWGDRVALVVEPRGPFYDAGVHGMVEFLNSED
ncbi:MAG TPA: hypothetical protein VJL80_06375 [Aeromicrobium sp.]|nr:hypothetical protein [Aeromicrobium sp.]HKY57644.1 hypothetical protein [Aeromicrobium sp.]